MNPISKLPVVVYAESTPNPSAMKFVASRILFDNPYPLEFLNPAQAASSPLASELFKFPFVESVFILGNYITVFKSETVQWEEVTLELREFLRNYLIEEKEIFNAQDMPSAASSMKGSDFPEMVDHTVPVTEIEKKIVGVLEEYVAPAVGQDGGMIVFRSYKEGVVSLTMRGACSGCPSATVTLKSGIEALLKKFVPEVKEVISIG
jgi:Fe-S cluster biogenesis protein NfuA